jgi:hypothetical protein
VYILSLQRNSTPLSRINHESPPSPQASHGLLSVRGRVIPTMHPSHHCEQLLVGWIMGATGMQGAVSSPLMLITSPPHSPALSHSLQGGGLSPTTHNVAHVRSKRPPAAGIMHHNLNITWIHYISCRPVITVL